MTSRDGWDRNPLGSVADLIMGQSPDSKYYSDDETDLPFLQGCAEFGSHSPRHAIYCSQSKKVAPEGSILFSVRAPVGRLNVADREYIVGRGLAAISGARVSSGYLEHYLRFEEQRFRSASQGSTFEAINSSELNRWPITYPLDGDEQSKIAEILSTADRAIEQMEALIAKQQRIKTGLMQDLLTRGIDEHGNLRSEQTHEFKDSPLGRIPVKWDMIPLGEAGVWSSGGTPSKANSQFWGGDIPWVCPKDMKVFDLSDSIDRITPKGAQRGSRVVPAGTVFIVVRGMILAHTFPVGYATRTMAFNQDIKAISAKSGLNSRYLAYWLAAHANDMLTIATTATHGTKRFDMDDLFAARIAVPQPHEQDQIVSAFNHIDHQIKIGRDQSQKLRSLKAGLLQDLLTGNRRVTALLAEPETVSA